MGQKADGFKVQHKAVHKSNALHNPFPAYPFTGSLRPVYPLSPRRTLPESIRRPNYSEDADPKYKYVGKNVIQILDKRAQDGMRKVCRLAREVLDIAAGALKPGVTTDYIDEIVHKACIERDVGSTMILFHTSCTPAHPCTGVSIASKLRSFPQISLYLNQ